MKQYTILFLAISTLPCLSMNEKEQNAQNLIANPEHVFNFLMGEIKDTFNLPDLAKQMEKQGGKSDLEQLARQLQKYENPEIYLNVNTDPEDCYMDINSNTGYYLHYPSSNKIKKIIDKDNIDQGNCIVKHNHASNCTTTLMTQIIERSQHYSKEPEISKAYETLAEKVQLHLPTELIKIQQKYRNKETPAIEYRTFDCSAWKTPIVYLALTSSTNGLECCVSSGSIVPKKSE